MNRPAPHSRRIPYIVAGTALFALLAFLLSQTGYYSFCYLEQWDTFIYNSAYLSGSLALPGGCVQLLSSFLTQFFCRPLTGSKHLPALRNGRTGRLSVQLPHTDHRIVLSQEEGTLVHIPSANGVPDR